MKRAIVVALVVIGALASRAVADGRCERQFADCTENCGDRYTCRLRCLADYKDCNDPESADRGRKIREGIRCERERSNCKSACPYDELRGSCVEACDLDHACEG